MASEQPQEKTVRLDAAAVQAALDQRDQRIQALEALLAKLRQAGGGAPPQNFNTMASKLMIVVLQELCSSTDLSEIESAIV